MDLLPSFKPVHLRNGAPAQDATAGPASMALAATSCPQHPLEQPLPDDRPRTQGRLCAARPPMDSATRLPVLTRYSIRDKGSGPLRWQLKPWATNHAPLQPSPVSCCTLSRAVAAFGPHMSTAAAAKLPRRCLAGSARPLGQRTPLLTDWITAAGPPGEAQPASRTAAVTRQWAGLAWHKL